VSVAVFAAMTRPNEGLAWVAAEAVEAAEAAAVGLVAVAHILEFEFVVSVVAEFAVVDPWAGPVAARWVLSYLPKLEAARHQSRHQLLTLPRQTGVSTRQGPFFG